MGEKVDSYGVWHEVAFRDLGPYGHNNLVPAAMCADQFVAVRIAD